MNAAHKYQNQNPALNLRTKSILRTLGAGSLLLASLQAQALGDFVSGQILVQPRPGLASSGFSNMVKAFRGQLGKHLPQINLHLIKVPQGREDEFVRLFAQHPHIAFAEKDLIVPLGMAVNDTYYASEWHLQKIQVPSAWDATQGSEQVVVAVLDTGVEATHLDLAGKLVAGWNIPSNNSDTSPIHAHGTQVAGVVAAVNNNARGVASVGWNTRVMPVRVTNDTSGGAALSDLINGLLWAADHGAKVANVSYDLGYYCMLNILDNAAQYFRSKGGVVVGAAGNGGSNKTCASDPYFTVVSATTSADTRASWSNYGAFVDVGAPGVGIYTTNKGGGYASVSGTSFSSPMTAAAVALMMAAQPGLTPEQYESLLAQSADNPGGGPLPNPYYGWGRINANKAVLVATQQYVPPDATPPAVAVVSPAGGSTVAGTQVVGVSAQDNVGVARIELYVDNQWVGVSTVGPSYEFSWDTTTVADGNVSLVAYAYDSAGNRGASMVNRVAVQNTP